MKLKKRTLHKNTALMFNGLSVVPTSHFYVNKEYEDFLNTLELNYILNKYFEQSNRDGVKSSVYSLNYGLCAENNIEYGRPKGDSKYRKYYIDRQFDYNNLLEKFMGTYKEFECTTCKQRYGLSRYKIVESANMICIDGCYKPSSYTEIFLFENDMPKPVISEEYQLPELEYDTLAIISLVKNPYATIVSLELDCSYQMVNSVVKKLVEKGLIEKEKMYIDGREGTTYNLTNLMPTEQTSFSGARA